MHCSFAELKILESNLDCFKLNKLLEITVKISYIVKIWGSNFTVTEIPENVHKKPDFGPRLTDFDIR